MKNFLKFLVIVVGLNALVGIAAKWCLAKRFLSEYQTGWLAGFFCVVIAEVAKGIVARGIRK